VILFVGDRPSKRMKPGAKPFEGAACEGRLMEWVYKLVSENEICAFVNTTDWHLHHILMTPNCAYRIIALGNIAAGVIEKYSRPHFKLPHPSGRNRQINDKEFIAKKLAKCKAWLKEQK